MMWNHMVNVRLVGYHLFCVCLMTNRVKKMRVARRVTQPNLIGIQVTERCLLHGLIGGTNIRDVCKRFVQGRAHQLYLILLSPDECPQHVC